MSADPWEQLLAQDDDPWEAALAADMPQVGVTLEGLDVERAAAEQSAFKPWSGPAQVPLNTHSSAGQALWGTAAQDYRHAKGYEDEESSLWESLAEGGRDAAYSAAGGVLSGVGVNPGQLLGDDVRASLQMANERSPIAAPVGQAIGEAGIQAAALPAKLLRAPVAAGAVGGGLSGIGSIDADAVDRSTVPVDPWEARLEALATGAGTGMFAGKAADLLGTGVQKGMRWAGDTVAPWMRKQGHLNRVASSGIYGGEMDRLAQNRGGEDGVAELGQWMENQGLTQWTPRGIADEAASMNSMWQGDQRAFIDDLAERPGGPPMVDTGAVSDQLRRRAGELQPLVDKDSIAKREMYRQQADALSGGSEWGRQGMLETEQMPFDQALRQRQAYDDAVDWDKLGGSREDALYEGVARDAANGLRGGLVESLENTSPELAPRWEAIQENLGNSATIMNAGKSRAMRELGNQPISLPTLIGGMGGIGGMAAAAAAKTGGRAAAANTLGKGAQAAQWIGDMAPGEGVIGASGALAGQYQGREQGAAAQSRGFLLPQAAMASLQNGGAELGPYAKQFADAANSPDSGAIAALISRLTQTDQQFRTQVLPQLQLMTAGGGV